MTIKQSSVFLKIILISFLIFSAVRAQGSIYGTITDSFSQQTLVGANIFLLGTAIRGATKLDGEYSIKNIPVDASSLSSGVYFTNLNLVNKPV